MTRTDRFQPRRRRPAAAAACLLLAACLATVRPDAAAAQAPEHPAPRGDAAETLAEGLEKLREGLTQLLEEIPRYAPPEVTENGDIILRRIDPPARERPAPAPGPREVPVPDGDGEGDGDSIRL